MDFPKHILAYINKKIGDKEFGDCVHSACMDIIEINQEKRTKALLELVDVLPYLPDGTYDQFPRAFMHFALNISDRLIYAQLTQYKLKFEESAKDLSKPNNLALFILNKVVNSENKFLLIYYLDERLDNIKNIDQKFVLLEMYLRTLKNLKNKSEMFASMFPTIFRPIKDGFENIVQLYLQKRFSDEKVADPQGYYLTFSSWILDYIHRFLVELKNLKELKSVKQTITVTSLFEFSENGQIFPKNNETDKITKHYCTLFMLNVYEQIAVLNNLSEGNVEIIQKSHEKIKKTVLEFLVEHPSQLVFSALSQFKFISYYSEQIQQQESNQNGDLDQSNALRTLKYTLYTPYNITSITILLLDLLKSPQFQNAYTSEYLLKLILPIFTAFYRQKQTQFALKIELLEILVKIWEKLPKKLIIQSSDTYETNILEIVDHILQNFGTKTSSIEFVNQVFYKHSIDIQRQILTQCMVTEHGKSFFNHFSEDLINLQVFLETYEKKNNHHIFSNSQQMNLLITEFSERIYNCEDLIETSPFLISIQSVIQKILEIKSQIQKSDFETEKYESILKDSQNILFSENLAKYLENVKNLSLLFSKFAPECRNFLNNEIKKETGKEEQVETVKCEQKLVSFDKIEAGFQDIIQQF